MRNEGDEELRFAWLAGSGGATPRKLAVFFPEHGCIALLADDDGTYVYNGGELALNHDYAAELVAASSPMPHIMVPGHEAGYTKDVPPPGPTSATSSKAKLDEVPPSAPASEAPEPSFIAELPSSESDDEVP